MGWLCLAHIKDHGVTIGSDISIIVRGVSPYHHAIIEVVNGSNPPFLYPLIKAEDYLKVTPDAFLSLNKKQTLCEDYQIKIAYLAHPKFRISRYYFGHSRSPQSNPP